MEKRATVTPVSYVLIAEPDLKRAVVYRQLMIDAGFDAMVARDGEEAKAILRRRGAPLLMLVELSLPRLDGFGLVTELRKMAAPSQSAAIVTSAFADLRSLAEQLREKLGIFDVLARTIPVRLLKASLLRAIQPILDARDAARVNGPVVLESTLDIDNLAQLAAQTAQRFHVPIVAIYLKLGHRQRFVVQAALDAIPPHYELSNEWEVIRRIIDVGEPMVIADAQGHPFFANASRGTDTFIRGFAGVPVLTEDDAVLGTLCLVDVEPLGLSALELDSLAAFGRTLGTALERRTRETAPPSEADAALLRLARTDALTGLANRGAGEETIGREVARAQRNASPLSYVFCDVDHFKKVNDTYGHAVGDRVLREISKALTASLRGADMAIRWGGDEFLLVLPDVDLSGAQVLAERVRATIEKLSVPELPSVSLSTGVAQWKTDQTIEEVINDADVRLRESKRARPTTG